MNTNNPAELFETMFYSALGATSELPKLLEPNHLQDSFAQIQENPAYFLQELAAKGRNWEPDFDDLFGKFGCPQSRTARLPNYQEWGGKQVFKQPYNIQNTEFYGFFVEGTMKNLQDLCDRSLNHLGSPVEYRPITNHILVSFDVVNKMSSIDQPDSGFGYFSEHEMIVWVLTAVGKQVGPFFKVDRLAWFVPYIFVSNASALLAGREVYGFPKTIGDFEIPKPDQEPNFFSMDALMLKDYSPHTKAENQRLIEIKRTKIDNNPHPIKEHENHESLMQHVIELLLGKSGSIDIPGIGLPLKIAEYLLEMEAPAVCLKQFRDVEDGNKACYQAIIELLMRTTKFHNGKILGIGDAGFQYELDVFKFASQPMIKDLGLQYQISDGQVAKIPVELSFYLNFDFIVNPGKVIWERPR